MREGELVIGRIEHRRLTLREIEALGIDTRAPENQFVHRFNVEFRFQEMTYEDYFIVPPSGVIVDRDFIRIPIPDENGEVEREIIVRPQPIPNPTRPELPPVISFMTMSGSTSFLREFFKVCVIVYNKAYEQFVLVDNEVRLNLPAGLTLAPTLERQSLRQTMGTIEGGGSARASWTIRGDKVGSFDLTANFWGTLMPFNERVEALFKTEEPLVVNGSRGLVMYLQPMGISSGWFHANQEYRIRFRLVNQSEIAFNMVTVRFGEGSGVSNNIVSSSAVGIRLHEGDSVTVETIYPGETFEGMFITTFLYDMDEETFGVLLLDVFVGMNGIPTVVLPPSCECEYICCFGGVYYCCSSVEVCECEEELVLPDGIVWLSYFDNDLDTRLYVSSEPLPSIGTFTNVYVGVAFENGSTFGDAFVLLEDGNWYAVGHVDMAQTGIEGFGIAPFGISPFNEPMFPPTTSTRRWLNSVFSYSETSPVAGLSKPIILLSPEENEQLSGFAAFRRDVENAIRVLNNYRRFAEGLRAEAFNPDLLEEIVHYLQRPWLVPGRVIELAQEVYQSFTEIVEALSYIASSLWNGYITLQELRDLLVAAGLNAVAGNIIYLVENYDKFQRFHQLTADEAYELGRVVGRALNEIAGIGLVVYAGAKFVGKAFTAVKVKVQGFIASKKSGFGNLTRAKEFGIHPYNTLRGKLQGTDLQAHHIIEKRFHQSVPDSVAVTRAEHQIFTNRWRHEFPYGGRPYAGISNAELWTAAQNVYRDFPVLLEVVRVALGF